MAMKYNRRLFQGNGSEEQVFLLESSEKINKDAHIDRRVYKFICSTSKKKTELFCLGSGRKIPNFKIKDKKQLH